MTALLPEDVQQVFDRFITTEYTTVDRRGQPITWPVTPYYKPGDECIDVTTGLGYPKKADDAAANPKVALLFSEPNGSGLDSPPTILVQGTAVVDDRDLEANRERYARESVEKLPATQSMHPPKFVQKMLDWYYKRIYVHVRPERVYIWRAGAEEPELLDAHLEEVRSGHNEEPDTELPGPRERKPVWDPRVDELGEHYSSGVLSLVAPDGFPFSSRVPVAVDSGAKKIRIEEAPAGAPLIPGLACLTAHDHAPDFTWQRNFQVRGDLVPDDEGGWSLVPAKFVGGFELPPGGTIGRMRANASKIRRFRKIAKRELAKRS